MLTNYIPCFIASKLRNVPNTTCPCTYHFAMNTHALYDNSLLKPTSLSCLLFLINCLGISKYFLFTSKSFPLQLVITLMCDSSILYKTLKYPLSFTCFAILQLISHKSYLISTHVIILTLCGFLCITHFKK